MLTVIALRHHYNNFRAANSGVSAAYGYQHWPFKAMISSLLRKYAGIADGSAPTVSARQTMKDLDRSSCWHPVWIILLAIDFTAFNVVYRQTGNICRWSWCGGPRDGCAHAFYRCSWLSSSNRRSNAHRRWISPGLRTAPCMEPFISKVDDASCAQRLAGTYTPKADNTGCASSFSGTKSSQAAESSANVHFYDRTSLC